MRYDGTDDIKGLEKALFLIDGNSLIYRAFFALPPLTGPDGRQTNAAYGFVNMLFRLLNDYSPSHIVVAFDRGTPQFRVDLYEEYKAHRPDTPDELRPQMGMIREILEALGIAFVSREGFEADDLLASLARRFACPERPAVLVSGDRDVLQVLSDHAYVLLTRRGITEMELYTADRLKADWGITPRQVVDLKGLMGDSSDNIPGVPGVGEKTALKLLRQFSSVEEVLDHLDQVSGKALPRRLRENADKALMSKDLAALRFDVELDIQLDDCQVGPADGPRVREAFRSLGFGRLLERLPSAFAYSEEEAKGSPAPAEAGGSSLDTTVGWGDSFLDRAAELVSSADREKSPLVLIHRLMGADPLTAGQAFLGVCKDDRLVLLSPPDGSGRDEDLRRLVRQVACCSGLTLVGHDLKPLLAWAGAGECTCDLFDTQLAAYLLDPSRSTYPLAELAQRFTGLTLTPQPDFWGKGARTREPGEVTDEELAAYAGPRASALQVLPAALRAEMESLQLVDLYQEVELPLLPILVRMQMAGIQVDPDILEEMGAEMESNIERLERDIWSQAGHEFNINSTQQLGQVLFEEMGLPVVRRTKTGYSTDASVLEQLGDHHQVARLILEYRRLVKLKGTYVDGLLGQIDPRTGRVHTTFHQSVTATGRLSSANPNLQNIPTRDEAGRRLRRAFTAPDGHRLLAADYSQIELRILAHISGDEKLLESFHRQEDIHTRTASEVFGVDLDDVTPQMRFAAKAVNFGIVYGISDYGLSQNLGISREEAARYIESYLSRYPGVKEYLRGVVRQAKEDGYVRTLFGRIRYLPDLSSRVRNRREFARRAALNTPIQGTAADIMKKAMVDVARAIDIDRAPARMLLQVHDELIFEVPQSSVGSIAALVKEAMEHTADLDVPLVVDVKEGPDWYSMSPYEAISNYAGAS